MIVFLIKIARTERKQETCISLTRNDTKQEMTATNTLARRIDTVDGVAAVLLPVSATGEFNQKLLLCRSRISSRYHATNPSQYLRALARTIVRSVIRQSCHCFFKQPWIETLSSVATTIRQQQRPALELSLVLAIVSCETHKCILKLRPNTPKQWRLMGKRFRNFLFTIFLSLPSSARCCIEEIDIYVTFGLFNLKIFWFIKRHRRSRPF